MRLSDLLTYLQNHHPLPEKAATPDEWPDQSFFIDEIEIRPVEELKSLSHPALRFIDFNLMKDFIRPAHVVVNQDEVYESYVHDSDTDVRYVHICYEYHESHGWYSPTGKHATTTFERGSKDVNVFSGMDEYLAWEMMQPNKLRCKQDAILVPEIWLFEHARRFMEKHEHVNLHLPHDNDIARQALAYAEWLNPAKYRNMSFLYSDSDSVIYTFKTKNTGR